MMVGNLEGTSESSLSGPAVGWLQGSGVLAILFAPEGMLDSDGEQDIVDNLEVTLDESGNITDSSGQIRFEGSFDLYTCEGRGDWSAGTTLAGTWVLHPREYEY